MESGGTERGWHTMDAQRPGLQFLPRSEARRPEKGNSATNTPRAHVRGFHRHCKGPQVRVPSGQMASQKPAPLLPRSPICWSYSRADHWWRRGASAVSLWVVRCRHELGMCVLNCSHEGSRPKPRGLQMDTQGSPRPHHPHPREVEKSECQPPQMYGQESGVLLLRY